MQAVIVMYPHAGMHYNITFIIHAHCRVLPVLDSDQVTVIV